MKAVVLVGGKGTRLRPLTYTTPKQMLPVGGRAMIERVLEHLSRHGIDEVVLSLGYKPDAFLAAYPDGICAGVRLRYAVEDTPLDTAGAIAFAAGEAGIDETCVVVNGDILTGLDVTALIDFHRSRPRAEATIALTPVEDPSAFGVVPTDDDGRVLAFIEKPPAGEAPTNLVNAGTYVLEPAALARIPGGGPVSIERHTFPELVQAGLLYAMASDTDWLDAGTPAAYLRANLRYAGDPGASCRIGADVAVEGSVVGEGVVIGRGVRVERSVVLDGAEIGDGAVVADSIIAAGARVGAGAKVTALSVIGPGAEVGAGQSVSDARIPPAG